MIDPLTSLATTSLTRQVGALDAAQPQMPTASAASTSESFSATLSNMAADMQDNMRRGETASLDAIRGQANTQEVVEAVMSAERTLQTALAVRDKVVTAYLEISRMAI